MRLAVAVEMLKGSGRLFRRSPLARLRCTRDSSTKLFVGGLSYDTNETVLKDAFGHYGEITEVRVICDPKSGKSKGYGFVRLSSETASKRALEEMDGQKYPRTLCTACLAVYVDYKDNN